MQTLVNMLVFIVATNVKAPDLSSLLQHRENVAKETNSSSVHYSSLSPTEANSGQEMTGYFQTGVGDQKEDIESIMSNFPTHSEQERVVSPNVFDSRDTCANGNDMDEDKDCCADLTTPEAVSSPTLSTHIVGSDKDEEKNNNDDDEVFRHIFDRSTTALHLRDSLDKRAHEMFMTALSSPKSTFHMKKLKHMSVA